MTFYSHIEPPRPEVRAFLDDIREHPEDDTPRLILSDWLEEFGDSTDQARAELIRLQCRLASRSVNPRGMSAREQRLIFLHARQWLGPLFDLVDDWRIERGFLHITLRGHTLFDPRLLEMLGTEPYAWVEGLVLRQFPGAGINILEQQPLLAPVQVLTIEESRPTEAAVARLLHSPHLHHLRELHLAMCGVGPALIEVLAGSPKLAELRKLDLVRNTCGEYGLIALSHSLTLPQLRCLRIGHAEIPDRALPVLANSRLLAQLEELDLRGNQNCGNIGLAELLHSPNTSNLRRLDLGLIRLLNPAVEALAQSGSLTSLRRLHLDRTGLDDEAVKSLALGRSLPELEALSLNRNRFGDTGMVALANFSSRKLQILEAAHNHLDRDSAIALARSESLADLRELNLEDNQIRDAGALAIAAAQGFQQLSYLNAATNELGPLGKAVLLRRFGREVALV